MKILIIVQNEVTYRHIRSRVEKHEIAPFGSSEKAIRTTLGSFEPDVAIVEQSTSWAVGFKRTLNTLGVQVVPFDDDFQAVMQRIEELESLFDETEDDSFEAPEPEPRENYTPPIDTDRFELQRIEPAKEEDDPALTYMKKRMLRKEGVKHPEPVEPKPPSEEPIMKEPVSETYHEESVLDTPQESKPQEKRSMPKLKFPKLSVPKPSFPKMPDFPKFNFPSPQHQIDPSETVNLDLELVNPENRVVYRDQVVGTAVIAVMGISPGVGTTHTTTMIANYLARQKERVAVVEVCDSYAFARIERLFHGVPEGTILQTDHFEAFNVFYFKSSEDLDLVQLFAEGFTYIVLDLGTYDSGDHFKEFLRSNIPVLVGAGSEWKQQDIYRFCRQHKKKNQSNWNITIPLVEKEAISDIKKGIETSVRQVVALPYHPDPFEEQPDTDAALKTLLQLRGKRKFGIFR